MVRRARPNFLRLIVDELLVSCGCTDKENDQNEGRRDISCLGELTLLLHSQQLTISLEGYSSGDALSGSTERASGRQHNQECLSYTHQGELAALQIESELTSSLMWTLN
jgi:hypothetical protein